MATKAKAVRSERTWKNAHFDCKTLSIPDIAQMANINLTVFYFLLLHFSGEQLFPLLLLTSS